MEPLNLRVELDVQRQHWQTAAPEDRALYMLAIDRLLDQMVLIPTSVEVADYGGAA